MPGRREGGERVFHVVGTDQRPLHRTLQPSALEYIEARIVFCPLCGARGPRGAHVLRTRAREPLERRPAAHLQGLLQSRVGGIPDNEAAAGDDAHEMVELPLNRLNIRINVSVIVFEVVEHHRAGVVVNELGALVEEGRVVFIGFDDEERRLAQTGAATEVGGYATYEKPGRKSRI